MSDFVKKNIDYNYIVNSVNNIFINIDDDISKFIYDTHNIITRNTKLSYSDAFYSSLVYSQTENTKIDIVNKFNFDNNKDYNISRTTFHNKELMIPLSFYSYIYNKLNDIYNDNFVDKNLLKFYACDNIIYINFYL